MQQQEVLFQFSYIIIGPKGPINSGYKLCSCPNLATKFVLLDLLNLYTSKILKDGQYIIRIMHQTINDDFVICPDEKLPPGKYKIEIIQNTNIDLNEQNINKYIDILKNGLDG